MLRPPSRFQPKVFSVDTPLRWAGLFWLCMAIGASPALGCTAADMTAGHGATEGDAGMAPAEGLKLRTRQEQALLSASYLAPAAQPAERNAALNEGERAPRPSQAGPAQPAPDPTAAHGYKPLAMLAAALALMVTIALRRSGKR